LVSLLIRIDYTPEKRFIRGLYILFDYDYDLCQPFSVNILREKNLCNRGLGKITFISV